MYKGEKIAAFIPARGGSKGIPRKNIKLLDGKPLIAYSIEAARNSCYVDEVFVSTEDEEIADIARRFGAKIPCMRPLSLAGDKSTTLEVVLHAIGSYISPEEWDSLVLLQPTQPLRTAEDIDNAIESFYLRGGKGLVSVSEVTDHPVLIRYFDNNDKLIKIINTSSTVRRQDMPKMYRVNGAIYINKVTSIHENTSFNDNEVGFIMNKYHSIDIDDMDDFELAEFYLQSGKAGNYR